jgi:thiamine-monophosphate kinase
VELSFIRWLRERIATSPQVVLGLGDDAAVLQPSAGAQLVVTTDMLMDGTDFHVADTPLAQIGRKSLGVNLSDLAAMGARPLAAFVSVALPRSGGEAIAQGVYEGLLAMAAEYQIPIAGGDTNSWDGPLVVSVTALGEVPAGRAWTRSGANPGDEILVTGQFGGSILGRHLDFVPRLREAGWLAANARVHAAIDVSDGLSLDLSRIAEESDCGAVLQLDQIPISDAATRLAAEQANGTTPLDHALADGEDFELILAVPPKEAERLLALQPLGVPLTRIGQFVEQRGLWSTDASGGLKPLEPRGWVHRLDD